MEFRTGDVVNFLRCREVTREDLLKEFYPRGVTVSLGGPSGVGPLMQGQFSRAHSATGITEVFAQLPGGLQHSAVALADVLTEHRRGALIPPCES